MYLSSKLVARVGLGTLLLAPAAAVAGSPAAAGYAPAGGRAVAPRVMRIGPRLGARVGRRLPRYGYGALGFAGAALGTAAFAQQGYGSPPTVVNEAPEPPPIPPQPACPMIIKIGPGLDHPVQTRVIYGRPECY